MSLLAKAAGKPLAAKLRRVKPMTPGVPHAARIRAYLTGALISAGILGVTMKAYALQVDNADLYQNLAEKQHAMAVSIPAPRGEIVDTRGRPLAISADTDSIWANPREIVDVTDTAEKLAKLLPNLDASALEAKLGTDRSFVWLSRRVSPELAAAIAKADIPGIEIAREPRRWYPSKTIAGPIVGRADIDGIGVDGIELSLNEQLTGTQGAGNALRDARGRRMFADGMAQPLPGSTVQLTIDRSLQAIADEALAAGIATNSAKGGVAIVLDVATSRVLAMSTAPTYDPNIGMASPPRNKPVTDAYEAGSVLKLFSVSAALDAGVVSPTTIFDVQFVQLGPKMLRDHYHDVTLDVAGIIKRSSNVGTVKITQRLGKAPLEAAYRRFGFGTKTGIELPGEQSGRLRSSSTWRDVEHATMAYGYGLTITPLQLAAGVAAIGNDGVYRSPRIVESITKSTGEVEVMPVVEGHVAIKPKTAQQMRTMMGTVFEGGKGQGTGQSVVVPGFYCGAKSGTARKWDAENKEYSTEKYLSSFVGLAPLDKPRIAIVVTIDEPSEGAYFGGAVAGPVFAAIASESLRYLGVPGESLVCPPPTPGKKPLVTPPKICTIPAPPVSKTP
jgi:cell division protein FtsI (penicillin-binding protein 3)